MHHPAGCSDRSPFVVLKKKRRRSLRLAGVSTQQFVSRVLSLREVALAKLVDHSSGTRVAARLVRPTLGLGRATLRRPSTWPCSGWGLPCRWRCPHPPVLGRGTQSNFVE